MDKYRLELHWVYSEKLNDENCKIHQAYFSGPALKIAKQISPNNNIVIDLSKQYSMVLDSHYFVTLFWGDVRFIDDKVFLGDARIFGRLVNKLSNLTKNDYIIINTQMHEEKIHMYNLVYPGRVYTREGREKI